MLHVTSFVALFILHLSTNLSTGKAQCQDITYPNRIGSCLSALFRLFCPARQTNGCYTKLAYSSTKLISLAS